MVTKQKQLSFIYDTKKVNDAEGNTKYTLVLRGLSTNSGAASYQQFNSFKKHSYTHITCGL